MMYPEIPKKTLIIPVLLLLAVNGCSRQKVAGEDSPAVQVPVTIGRLTKGNFELNVVATGSTEVLQNQKVLSPVAGRVVSIHVLEGTSVKKGDALVSLRTREAQAAIDGAEALVLSATTESRKQEALRARRLADSLQPVIIIRAAFDGVVVSRRVAEGELVVEQAELLTLINPSTIVFIADVSINSITLIRPGLDARIRFPDFPIGQIDAVVDAVSPQAEAQSRSINVRLRLKNLTPLQQRYIKTNVSGIARIITGIHQGVLLVNRACLLHDDESNTNSIVIMTPDSLARIIPVTLVAQSDSVVEIQNDVLHAGDRVITRGQYALTDSTRVTVESSLGSESPDSTDTRSQ